MLENKNEEFDLRVREMLADAEEKAPRGVWEAVSGRLAGAAAPVSRKAVPFWYAFSGAVAAALVGLGLFLPRSGQSPAENGIALVEAPASQGTKLLAQAESKAAENVRTAATTQYIDTQIATEKSASTPSEYEAAKPASTASDTESASIDRADAGQDPAQAGVTGADDAAVSRGQVDPFALMEWEDVRDAAMERESDLTVQCALGGNDSDFGIGGRTYFAPGGSTVSTTGIREESTSAYGIPLSLGVGVRKYLTRRLSIAGGASWSLVTRTFDGTYNEVENGVLTKTLSGDVYHSMHFVGIPVGAYYDIVDADRTKLHLFALGQAEYCVSNSYTVRAGSESQVFRDSAKGIQWSVGAGIGVEFGITDLLGIYLDPGVRYYFHYSGQPGSVRSEKPFMVNIEAGLRFKL